MLRILLVTSDDTLQTLFERVLQGQEEVRLAGIAGSEAEAVAMAARLKPDLVAIAPRVGNIDSARVVKEIMVEAPAPVVVVAAERDPGLQRLAADALSSGALAVLAAPPLRAGKPNDTAVRRFLSTLSAMSQVKIVRHWRRRSDPSRRRAEYIKGRKIRIVAIAASTGGPAAIKTVLQDLSPAFPAPVLVVQHISNGFIAAVASSLDAVLPLRVKVAENGEELVPGTVYFAPDDRQMGLEGKARIRVSDDPAVDGFKPSGTYLFASAAREFAGEALAVVLTGMGRDGTDGLRQVRKSGGVTLAQDEESSVVFGMPKAAIEAGLVDRVLPLSEIAGEIGRLAGVSPQVVENSTGSP